MIIDAVILIVIGRQNKVDPTHLCRVITLLSGCCLYKNNPNGRQKEINVLDIEASFSLYYVLVWLLQSGRYTVQNNDLSSKDFERHQWLLINGRTSTRPGLRSSRALLATGFVFPPY